MTSQLTAETLSRAFTVSPVPLSAPATRRWVRQMLHRWHLTQLSERAEVLVSELVTNAIRHADTGGAPITTLMIYTAGTLRIEVRDRDAANLPIRRPPSHEGQGHGLRIVEAYAHRWNVRPTDRGKIVWAELDIRPQREAVTQ
jgi:anti-sigma regulatory factor (Ser/Thr protein kinase)